MQSASFIDKLAWVYLQDRKILITRSKGKDTYYIPGGKRENGETDLQALTREVKEELNVELVQDTIKFMGVFEAQAHGKPEGTIVRMTCYTGDYLGQLFASSEIEEIAWFKTADKEKTSLVDHLIFDFLHTKDLID